MNARPDAADQSRENDPAFDELVAPLDDAGTEAAPAAAPARGGVWTTIIRRNRVLWTTAGIAVLALVAGLLIGKFVISPADAAAGAEAPTPGLVTVPVEFGPLSNDVTIRGDIGFADPVEVQIDTSAISGPAVVTGQVPEVGAELGPLAVALEVAGRPVITLPGELPAYRTLRVGVAGPDVVQFKEAMRAVGLDAGEPSNNVFDEQAAASVTELYAAVGYTSPAAEEGAEDGVRAAQAQVTSSERDLATARNELAKAGNLATEIASKDLDIAIAEEALRELEEDDATTTESLNEARAALALANFARQNVSVDTSALQAAVDSAAAALTQAQEDLASARQSALPALPAGEVLYLTELPRRVDAVTARRGGVLEGAAMTVSGATVAITGSAAEADAQLLEVGSVAAFDLPDGTEQTATVTAVAPGGDGEARWSITLEPAELTPDQISQLQGSNVRVRIAVGATAGDVLSVPAAALTAGPGGETRVEVVQGDPRDPDVDTALVVVETGLSAGGAVEIRAVEGELDEGALVVVGR